MGQNAHGCPTYCPRTPHGLSTDASLDVLGLSLGYSCTKHGLSEDIHGSGTILKYYSTKKYYNCGHKQIVPKRRGKHYNTEKKRLPR